MRSVKTRPGGVWLLLLGSLVVSVAGLTAQNTTDKQVDAAWQALQRGDGGAAAAAFADAIRRYPADPTLRFGAGAAAHQLGHDDDAVTHLERALSLNPKLTVAADLLGQIKYQQGDLERAIQVYEAALKSATSEQTAMRKRLEEWHNEATTQGSLTRLDAAQFSVYFDGRSENALAAHAVAVLERAFLRIIEKMGGYPSNRVLVTLYSEQQFRDITHAPAWSTGVFDGKVRIPVHGAVQNMDEFDRVLVHEFTHAIIYGIAPRGVPAWLHEGLASYFEPREPADAQRRLGSVRTVLPFSALQDSFLRFNASQAAVAYDESLVAVDMLMHLIGPRMAVLLGGLGNGQSFDESLRQLGMSEADFESQVLRHLRP